MLKRDFLIAAFKTHEYKRRAFIYSAFAITKEAPDDWKKDPYPYRIVCTPTGYFFVNPTNTQELLIIEDGVANTPLFNVKEPITITAEDIPNATGSIETTYGRLLFNYTALAYPFGKKIPYINEQVTPSKVEELIIKRLKDNPEKDSDRNEQDIYIDEYLKFTDAMFYMVSFTQLCVPAFTPKSIITPVGINEYKKKLLEENKDKLSDPSTIAKIDAALVEYDKKWLEGDESEGFLISNKSRKVVRKKLYGMVGAEQGLEDKMEMDLVPNSLAEGWDINKFPEMSNIMRAGSFKRGAETQLGGVSVKWFFRATSNCNVTVDDCGSKLGMDFLITENTLYKTIGFTEVGKSERITEETAKQYVGKIVKLRSPMYCKLDKTDYCKTCVGERLANNPTALSVAITEYGSVMMAASMSAVHGKVLSLAKINYKEDIF